MRPARRELEDLGPAAALVVEAAPEDLELKRELFARLEAVVRRRRRAGHQHLLALGDRDRRRAPGGPERICGMHFFNPPALMKLVEVVAGEATGEPALARDDRGRRAHGPRAGPLHRRARLHRQPLQPAVRARVAADDRARASPTAEQIDRIVREDGGYRMGPFELMDLIGIDVNLSVARSFFEQRPEPRWEPHPIQERMVACGPARPQDRRGLLRVRGRQARRGAGARLRSRAPADRARPPRWPSSSTRAATPPTRGSPRPPTSTPRCDSASTTPAARSSGWTSSAPSGC